jgi:hypothetical protein
MFTIVGKSVTLHKYGVTFDLKILILMKYRPAL